MKNVVYVQGIGSKCVQLALVWYRLIRRAKTRDTIAQTKSQNVKRNKKVIKRSVTLPVLLWEEVCFKGPFESFFFKGLFNDRKWNIVPNI